VVTPSGPFIRENNSIIYNLLIALYGILITSLGIAHNIAIHCT
jgi:hypothetical protein